MEAHKGLDQDMKKNPKRQTLHHLLVFDKKVKLVNHTFSGDAEDILKGTVPMDADHALNKGTKHEVECHLLGMAVHWRIAVEGGKQLEDANEPMTTMFSRFAKLTASTNPVPSPTTSGQ